MFSEYNITKSLCGAVPTLRQAVEAYHKQNVIIWMTTLLANLSTYMGYSNMPNSTQVEGILEQFMQKYSHLRVTEIMYYFECIKDGRYYEANIKLEPQALIKGVVTFLGDLNVKKERWGNAGDEYTPEQLKGICIEMLTDRGIDINAYDKNAMATLLGYYYPITREMWMKLKPKVQVGDHSWINDLKKQYS